MLQRRDEREKQASKPGIVISAVRCVSANVRCVHKPDIFILVDVDLVELLRAEFIFQTAHVGDHLQGNKARQDGEHQTLLLGQICLNK